MSGKLVLVTGLSGSGKSIALHTLEDAGYYCIDNLPVSLLETFVEQRIADPDPCFERVAIGVDARIRGEGLARVPLVLDRLRRRGDAFEILFLDADDKVLIQRFSETRRRHPLTDEQHDLAEAIALERRLLEPFLSLAELRIDTTRTSLHDLREQVRERVGRRDEGQLSLMFESFGFKHGLPVNADLVYDARCLPNPHWHPELRPLTGRDAAVAAFLSADPKANQLFTQVVQFLDHWIPCFEADGRSYLTVAVGCTGGQHRSVYLTERLADHFRANQRKVLLRHRELR